MANRHTRLARSTWFTTAITVAIGASLAGIAMLTAPPAEAVHDEPTPFQLDGNPTKSIGGGSPAVNLNDDDWDYIFELGDGSGTPAYPTPRLAPVASQAQGETFVVDSHDPDDSAFVQSNKDVDEVNTWNYGTKGISPPKDDITNAYANAELVPGYAANDMPGHPSVTHDHLVVYFGSDRFADDGDSAMGYWFFKGDVGLGPNGKFTGTHQVGDVLIQIDYRGAGNNEIEVFKWVGTGGNAGGGKLQRLVIGTSNNPADTICNSATNGFPADSACITTNIVERDSPWTYVGKGEDYVGDNRFPARVFMEGGFDVTALVGDVCFSSFMAETRTSHSETASLKDFALGSFDLCSVDVEKMCVAGSQTINAADETFTTTHRVTISNTGFGGSLRDVELADTTVVDADNDGGLDPAIDKVCTITNVETVSGTNEGLAGTGFVFNQASDSVEVADKLGGSILVTLSCTTPDNPFQNRVEVKARAATGAPQDITDADLETTTEAGVCAYELSEGLAIKKWCQGDDGTASGHPMGMNPYYYGLHPGDSGFDATDPRYQSNNPLELGVFLKPSSYSPEVCVDIEIANTSTDQRMVFNDSSVDCATADFGTETKDYICDTDLGNLVPTGGLTLEPAGHPTGLDKKSFSRCYTPTGPDGSDGTTPVDPAQALYSDTARAQAHGKLNGERASAGPVTATCKLCPTCPDCGT